MRYGLKQALKPFLSARGSSLLRSSSSPALRQRHPLRSPVNAAKEGGRDCLVVRLSHGLHHRLVVFLECGDSDGRVVGPLERKAVLIVDVVGQAHDASPQPPHGHNGLNDVPPRRVEFPLLLQCKVLLLDCGELVEPSLLSFPRRLGVLAVARPGELLALSLGKVASLAPSLRLASECLDYLRWVVVPMLEELWRKRRG